MNVQYSLQVSKGYPTKGYVFKFFKSLQGNIARFS